MQDKVFKIGARVSGGLGSSFCFESEEALKNWLSNEFLELKKQYGTLSVTKFELPGLKPGDTCCVYGEGLEEFKIESVICYSPHRYGFVLDSGWTEEVVKCFIPN